jgi:hypothetical protein
MQEGQQECGSFPGTRLSAGNDVFAIHDDGDDLLLDGGGRFVTCCVNGFLDGFVKGEFGELQINQGWGYVMDSQR